MSECQVGFQPMGHVCTLCPNSVCIGRRSESHDVTNSPVGVVYYLVCRGLDGIDALLPAEVPRFSGCTIVNGNLHFDFTTYNGFM